MVHSSSKNNEHRTTDGRLKFAAIVYGGQIMKLDVTVVDVWAAGIPIKGARQIRAAKKAGFAKTVSLRGVRVAAVDKPGLGATLTGRLADAGINLRGLSAASIGRRAIFHLSFDSAADANKAMRLLKR